MSDNNNGKIVLSIDIPKTVTQINADMKKLQTRLKKVKTPVDFFREQMSQAAESLTQWVSASSAVTLLISKTRDSISELKEINTLLTGISIENDKLSRSDLARIGNNSLDAAGRYGKSAADYLTAVQEAFRAGYENAEDIAGLFLAAQSTGSITAESANQLVITADKAYKMNGSVTELAKVLDGMNYIASHNAVNMAEMAEGMSAAGSSAASFGVDIDEAAAALGTMIAATQQSGSSAADAFRAVLLNIRQVSDEEAGIDAEGLARYEAACSALNVRLKETKNGVLSLRDPMEVLEELAAAYNRLEKTDPRRTALLDSAGSSQNAEQLDALLTQWDTYETMLQQYADGTGSMAREAEKMADSWEGSLHRLSNTWTSTVKNVADSDAVITAVNVLNSLFSVVNHVSDKLGSLGTIGLGAGLLAGVRNTGKRRMSVRISNHLPDCFEYALHA